MNLTLLELLFFIPADDRILVLKDNFAVADLGTVRKFLELEASKNNSVLPCKIKKIIPNHINLLGRVDNGDYISIYL